MPRVWYGVPSARPAQEAQRCFDAWREMGYAVAATRKYDDLDLDLMFCLPKYPGLWSATNKLASAVLKRDSDCEIFVTGGDDVFPDPVKRADEIADEFIDHFKGTLGVMQPTGGKPWSRGVDDRGRRITERCAWSPWLGREWCVRAYGGLGPTWPGFWHYFGDAYLQLTAEHIGLFWQRSDICQEHANWKTVQSNRPEHLMRSRQRWHDDKERFDILVAAGFPNSQLAP